MYRIEKKDVLSIAYGHWEEIFSGLAPDLIPAIDAKGKHVNCPFPHRHSTSGGRKKFRFDKLQEGRAICTCGSYDPFSLLTELNNWDFYQSLSEVNAFLGNPLGMSYKELTPDQIKSNEKKSQLRRAELEQQAMKRRKTEAENQARRNKKASELLVELWEGSVSVKAPEAKPLWSYLFKRGLDARLVVNSEALRFHPEISFFGVDGITTHPGMLAVMSDPFGKPVTMHRTYLDKFGNKADLPDGKVKLLAPYPKTEVDNLEGASIKLFSATDVLSVAEGIETALAVSEATGTPAWATYSALSMEQLDVDQLVLDGVKTLHIWADKDVSKRGEEAAFVLFERAKQAGLNVHGHLPSQDIPEGDKSIDWADIHAAGLPFPF